MNMVKEHSNNNNNMILFTVDFNLPYVITIITHLPAFSIGSQKMGKKIINPREKTGNVVIRHPL